MSITSEIRLRIKKEGDVALAQLSAKLNDVASRSVISNKKFKDLAATLKANDAQIKGKSINALNDYSRAWRELANSVDVTTKEFKEATAEAAKFERQAAKAQGRRGGSSLAGFAKGAGAIAAAGIFGGPEGAIGAGIGAIAGGPVGAAVGGAIGAQVGQVREALGATAAYAAELQKQRLALKLVTKDSAEYQRALKFISTTSKELAIPQDILTRQFTKLSASVIGAGGDVAATETAFKGVTAGIRGTGGSLQDLDSALTATAQVFSKGKVSAEELRQQIGERLPGAFTLFAEAMGMTPQQLDKALEAGEVSLQDFQKFAEQLFREFGDSAKIIADSPAAAGDRLKTALSNLSASVGTLLQPIGASFQTTFANIANAISDAADELNRFFGIAGEAKIKKITEAMQREAQTLTNLENKKKEVEESQKAKGREPDTYFLDRQIRQTEANFKRLQNELFDLQAINRATQKIKPDKPKGLPGIDLGGGDQTSSKMKKTSQELYELGLLRVEALEREDALNVALLDHQIRLQAIGEMNADANTKNLAVAESRQKFEQDIEKHIENQAKKQEEAGNAAVKFETLVGDTLRSTQKLTEEEEKRIKNNQALVPIIEAGMTAIKLGVLSAEELADAIRKIKAAFAGQDGEKSFFEDFKESFKAGIKDMGDLAGNLGSTLAGAFRGASDVLTDFLTKGTADFKEFARSVLADLANILIQFALLEGLKAITGLSFANGGIMSKDGEVPLKKYAAGGIANSPQLAMFGEGSTPEAYVPLPDGRSIPVTMKGAGSNVQVDSINITVENTGEQLSPAAQKQIANQVQGIVMSTLVNERRSGGVLR